MKPLNILQKIIYWFRFELPTHFCKHEFNLPNNENITGTITGYMDCKKCGGLYLYKQIK